MGSLGKVASVDILGVPISIMDMSKAVDIIGSWIAAKEHRGRYVCVADAHNVMVAQHNAQHMKAMLGADAITPDGMPLVWVSWLRGIKETRRVSGPDLLPEVCERSCKTAWKHYFYGGADGVADRLAATLSAKYPGLQIVGTDCPPFRELSAEEKAAAIQRIKASGADIVWVGLGCPKQEAWMHDNVDQLGGVVLVGVGAAFDFLTGRVQRAPLWMQRSGLEWLHRLYSEPKRLWRRYLVLAPRFAVLTIAETLAMRRAQNRRPVG